MWPPSIRHLITRNGDEAIIEYADGAVPTTPSRSAPRLATMTDGELLDFWSERIEATAEEHRQSMEYVATEIPVDAPQVELYAAGNQWTPRGHVIRCEILSDAAMRPDLDDAFVRVYRWA